MSGAGGATPVGVVLDGDVEEFLVAMVSEFGRRPSTVEAYERDLAKYLMTLSSVGRTPRTASATDVRDHLARLRSAGRSDATVARAASAIRMLHRHLATEGVTPVDAAAPVEPPRRGRGLPKAISEGEVATLLGSVTGDRPGDLRDRAMLELLYGTGIRISELVGLDLVDLDLDHRIARVFGKGAKERIVPIGTLAADALADWLSTGRSAVSITGPGSRSAGAAVFLNQRGGRLTRQGAWGILKSRATAVGLSDRVHPHVLRHSCATHMLDRGADLRVVQELLGHASISTTQTYTLVANERVVEAFRAAHPRAMIGRA